MSKAAASLYRQPMAFVDIETTGANYSHGKVLEIGVLRVEDGQVVRSFRTLLSVGQRIPAFITDLTGITDEMTAGAPTFGEIATELRDILEGAFFVAHNVRFDYSFIKQEYKRLGQQFNPKLLCTVRLSRALYPGLKGHSLGKIIERFGFDTSFRHRAYDDAKVLWDFYRQVLGEFDIDAVEEALQLQLSSQTLPPHLEPDFLANLPHGPGVYVYEDEHGQPLYIGKSINIYNRILSHFSDDHRNYKELRLSAQVRSIQAIPTAGELSALLLESQMIKDQLPLHNRQLRRKRELFVVKLTTNSTGYNICNTVSDSTFTDIEPGKVLAIFKNRREASEKLQQLAKDFQLCPKLLGLEKLQGNCFAMQLGNCLGACQQSEPTALHNLRLSQAFATSKLTTWPYSGPVLIVEKSADLERTTGFIFDNWQLIARLEDELSDQPTIKKCDTVFDLDMYKIVRRFISTRVKGIQIKVLSAIEVSQLFAEASFDRD